MSLMGIETKWLFPLKLVGLWDGAHGDFGSRKHLISSLDQSLSRMGLEYVDISFLSPSPDTCTL